MEYTPLPNGDLSLPGPGLADLELEPTRVKRATPLPKLAILASAGIRASEPFLFYVIFPFVNEMLVEYGIAIDERSTGYHAGVLEAVLSFANMASMGLWVHIADTRGRRPVMLYATLATAFVGVLYGFPRSFSLLVICRILAGAMNGQAAIAKTYFSELSDETNEATAFSVMSLAWQIGWCLAAMAGGYLSHAERIFPSLSGSEFIRKYPYALPFLVVAIPPILSVALGYFVLPETLERRAQIDGKLSGNDGKRAGLTADWTPHMWQAVKMWSMLVCTNVSFQATLPLFLFTPVAAGGLGIGTGTIGTFYAIRALFIIGIEVPIYPRFHRRLGHHLLLKLQILFYPFLFLLFPIMSAVRRSQYVEGGDNRLGAANILLLGAVLVVEGIGQTVFISADLICTNAAPTQEMQSKYNAVVEGASKLFTMLTTWLASWLFAYSAGSQLCGGWFVWMVIWCLSLWAAWVIWTFKESAGWRSQEIEPATPMTPYVGDS